MRQKSSKEFINISEHMRESDDEGEWTENKRIQLCLINYFQSHRSGGDDEFDASHFSSLSLSPLLLLIMFLMAGDLG